MKIVLAPQAYKGSISALNVARAMHDGVRCVIPDALVELVPVADGGDGTLETLVESSNGKIRTSDVTGPLGESVIAQWGAMGDGKTAVIEMARTSGLALVPAEKRDPRKTTTYGLGETISHALDDGFRNFIIGIGGSATNDAGAGMAQALGVRLLDSNDSDLPVGGSSLIDLKHIDTSKLDSRIGESRFSVACDVSNPLCGPEGASAVYGPQKGATPEIVQELDAALDHFSKIVYQDLGIEIKDLKGAGAAGGLGAGLIAFLKGNLQSGVDIMLDAIHLEKYLKDADLVITGEGQLDFQTVYDKAPIGVARMAKSRGLPVIAIAGSLGEGFRDVHSEGIHAVSAITSAPMSLEDASTHAYALIASATEEALRFMKVGGQCFR